MSEPTSAEKTTKAEGSPAEKAGKPKKADARGIARERGRVKQGKAPKAKASKEPKREKTPKGEPQVIFAFRLTAAERDAIHRAAGPAKASRFVLGAALAAAGGDQKAFEALAAQARTNTTK